MLEEAADTGLRISTGYGMTETAAMATGLQPEEFQAGARNQGRPLPQVRLRLEADGRIVLAGESLFRGYFPDWEANRELTTEDLGRLDPAGHLTVLGRRDGLIITGGEKVRPEEVEAVLRATGQFSDVAVLGLADPEWGQKVVAAYAPGPEPEWSLVQAGLGRALAAAKRPKQFVLVAPWPRNPQGKVNRPDLAAAVRDRLQLQREDALPDFP